MVKTTSKDKMPVLDGDCFRLPDGGVPRGCDKCPMLDECKANVEKGGLALCEDSTYTWLNGTRVEW